MTAPPASIGLRTTCRACASSTLEPFLPLGECALANSFLSGPEEVGEEQRFPLTVHLCATCGLVQIVEVVPPRVLFEHYLYVTGTSDTIAAHNEGYADAVVGALQLGHEDLVIEVASNDGSLLERFRDRDVRVLGIEPARNIAAGANAKGIQTLPLFFDAATSSSVLAEHGPAKAVIFNNVLAHVDTPVEFLAAARELLVEGGRVVFEVPELAQMIERLEYDTVYHEHLCYFSVTALMRVCEEAGLSIERVDKQPIHGGSVRVWAASRTELAAHSTEVHELSERERAAGLTSLARMRSFASGVEVQRKELLELLEGWRARGETVAGYGAPAKGNTLLNYCGITTELLPYTVDKNPLKVGLLCPGQHIPVLPVEALGERRPDHVLVLAWNFADEIVRQQAHLREHGTRFWVPIPSPHELT